jgi:hypothetical protein
MIKKPYSMTGWGIECVYAPPVDNVVVRDGEHALRCACGKQTYFYQLKVEAVFEAVDRGWYVERCSDTLVISASCDECRKNKRSS